MRALSMLNYFVREVSLCAFDILSSSLAEHGRSFAFRYEECKRNFSGEHDNEEGKYFVFALSTFSATLKQKI